MLAQTRLNRILPTVAAVAAGLLVLFVLPASAQSQLPPCPTNHSAPWDMCVGAFTDPDDGERYVGEWRDGIHYMQKS